MKTEQSEKKSVNKSDTDEVEVQAVDNGDQSKEKKQTGRKRKRNSEQVNRQNNLLIKLGFFSKNIIIIETTVKKIILIFQGF